MTITPDAIANHKEQRDVFITLSLALYIFSNYWIRIPKLLIVGSLVLYFFLGLTFLKLILRQTPLRITPYSVGYSMFGLVGAFSYFYALNGEYVFNDLYLILVSLILTFSYIQYVRNYSSFVRIFFFYAYLPAFLALYLFLSGTLQNPGQRLGEYEFGNANNLATIMMVTECCLFWFLIYGRRRYLVFNIGLASIFLYIMALSGGRKYLLVPFVFLFLILLFEYGKRNLPKLVLFLMIFALVLLAGVWALINIPILYQQVGTRFAGLLSFFSEGVESTDSSTLIRYIMISKGWRWFLQEPIHGYGLNNFRVLIADLFGTGEGTYAHNNYIELMVDLGLAGIFIFYLIYFYIIARLVRIQDDATGVRNFFLAFMLALLLFEFGAVTYQLYIIQIFVALASAYISLHQRSSKAPLAKSINIRLPKPTSPQAYS